MFLGLITNIHSFETLPVLELQTHPLTEIKSTNTDFYIGRINKIYLIDNLNDKKISVDNTLTENQSEFLIECSLLFQNQKIEAKLFNWGSGNRSDLNLKLNNYVIIEKWNENTYHINNYLRLHILLVMIIINIVLAIIFVRKKIIYLVIIIFFSFILLNYLIIPLIIKGYCPVIITVFSLLLIFTLVLLSVYGRTKDFKVGFLSISANLLIMTAITYIITRFLKITGIWDTDFQALKYFTDTFHDGNINNLQNIIIATLIISAAGALLDVIINIISAVRELINNNKDLDKKTLKNSAYNIGYDIASTMSNTLIFIFIGTSLISFIYYSVIISPLYPVLNDANFVTEILAAITIIISFFITVKITIFFLDI